MFDMQGFLQDTGVPVFTNDDSAKVQPGWIGIQCPFCHSEGPYLGWNLKKGFATCWHCGTHKINEILESFLGPNPGRIKDAIRTYTIGGLDAYTDRIRGKAAHPTAVAYPYGTAPMLPAHRRYIHRRHFNPQLIESLYKIQGTGPISTLPRRLVIPITLNGILVSWTTRDIRDTDGPKYISCPKELEVVPHKSIVYGIDLARTASCVVVEGPTDVWRLGPGAVATFGIKFTPAQVNFIAGHFERAFVFYDNEDFAVAQATRLCRQLSVLGVKTEVVTIDEGDPGDLPQEEADYIMVDLLKGSAHT